MNQIRSRFDGYRRAKKVYMCEACGTYYNQEILALLKIKGKPKPCMVCKCPTNYLIFDSEKEFKRYCELVLFVKLGKITDLKIQQTFECKTESGILIEKYIADTTYYRDGQFIVEDVKPLNRKTGKALLSPEFNRKKKWMRNLHRIEIEIYF